MSPQAQSILISKTIPYYVAGVVEYSPSDVLAVDLNHFISIIESNETKTVDILVFPELVLNDVTTATSVPNAKDYIRPCGLQKYSKIIQDLSCSANRGRKYVVVNLTMKLNCSDEIADLNKANVTCPESGHHFYNTAVVFDRNGVVIAT